MKKIIIIIYLIILTVLLYYAINIFMARKNENSIDNKTLNKKTSIIFNQKDATQKTTGEATEETTDNSSASMPTKPAYEITQEDCHQQCAQIIEKAKKKYCQQICGLTISSPNTGDCEKQKELNKDYCLRDQAVKEKDFQKCNLIYDSGIKRQCVNRINEDIIDDIM